MRRILAAFALGVGLAASLIAQTQACTIDNKPSAYANNTVAVITYVSPGQTIPPWWAHFTFPKSFRAGQKISLREDDAQVRTALAAVHADFSRHWLWQFGDGSQVIADQTTHVFRHPGHYRIAVNVFLVYNDVQKRTTFRQWEPIDTISITIT